MKAVRKPFGVLMVTILMVTFFFQSPSSPTVSAETDSSIRILAWTAYTDIDQEYAHTLDAIEQYYTDFSLAETTTTSATTLQSTLAGKNVFLIPEQEWASYSDLFPIGSSWSTVLNQFLQEGGIIVVLDFSWGGGSGYGLLEGAGLMDVTVEGYGASDLLQVVQSSHPLVEGLPSSFYGDNGTLHFSSTDGEEIVEKSGGGESVVLTKDIGSGHIALIGFDFYEYNDDMARLLANAIQWESLPDGLSGYVLETYPATGLMFLEGVSVTVQGTTFATTTDSRGHYHLPLPAGDYHVTYSKSGYASTSTDVTISADVPAIAQSLILISEECWEPEAVCANEVFNVVPFLGVPSELGGFLDNLCVIGKLREEAADDEVAWVLFWMVIDAVDVPGWGDAIDIVEGVITCLTSYAYDNTDWEEYRQEKARQEAAQREWQRQATENPLILFTGPSESGPIAASHVAATQSLPLELHIYSDSQHLGLKDGEIEYTIPHAYLFEGEDGSEIALIRDATSDYEIRIIGQGTAICDVVLATTQTDGTGTLVSYENLTIQDGMIASLVVEQSTTDFVLEVDSDGNGTVDDTVLPDSIEELSLSYIYLPLVLRNYP